MALPNVGEPHSISWRPYEPKQVSWRRSLALFLWRKMTDARAITHSFSARPPMGSRNQSFSGVLLWSWLWLVIVPGEKWLSLKKPPGWEKKAWDTGLFLPSASSPRCSPRCSPPSGPVQVRRGPTQHLSLASSPSDLLPPLLYPVSPCPLHPGSKDGVSFLTPWLELLFSVPCPVSQRYWN